MDSRKFLYDNNELFQSILLPSQDLPASALYVVGLPDRESRRYYPQGALGSQQGRLYCR